MAGNSQGRKKSEFIQQGTVLANSYLDYVVNGTNYKISYDNFVANLGVTGSIIQTGAVTGAPVLDVDGSVNKIRTIENGSGVLANVSAENGIKLSHNFVNDGTGTPIFLSTTADQPVFASLVAGNGISLTSTNNYVTIDQVGVAEYANVTMHGNSTETVIASTATAVPVFPWYAKVHDTFVSKEGYSCPLLQIAYVLFMHHAQR